MIPRYDELLRRKRPVDPSTALIGAGRRELIETVRTVRDEQRISSDDRSEEPPSGGR